MRKRQTQIEGHAAKYVAKPLQKYQGHERREKTKVLSLMGGDQGHGH